MLVHNFIIQILVFVMDAKYLVFHVSQQHNAFPVKVNFSSIQLAFLYVPVELLETHQRCNVYHVIQPYAKNVSKHLLFVLLALVLSYFLTVNFC